MSIRWFLPNHHRHIMTSAQKLFEDFHTDRRQGYEITKAQLTPPPQHPPSQERHIDLPPRGGSGSVGGERERRGGGGRFCGLGP